MSDPVSPLGAPAAASTPDVLAEAAAWIRDGCGVALATVTATWGSSPRPAGSVLAVDHGGRMAGSVSGGCVEGAVLEVALRCIAAGGHETLSFGVTDEMAWEVGLACGGDMQVFVDRLAPVAGAQAPAWLAELTAARAAKRAAVVCVELASGERSLLLEDALGSAEPALAEEARSALREDAARLLPDGPFLQPFNPPLRLVIVGAVHIAQPLCRMAAEVGYELIVVDPRGAFASPERFPGVALCGDWPDEALEALDLDARTAVVTLTHDPKLDDPALAVALRSKVFYVGCLGSRRTQARRLERLAALGLGDEALARIHGPVGLDIGARSPAEIAVSILAEITARLRARTP